MKPSIGDYVIINSGKKNCMAKIIGLNPIKALIDGKHLFYNNREDFYVEISKYDIVANLGKKPEAGNAYKVNIEPYYKTYPVKPWGPVHIFTHLEEHEWNTLKNTLLKVGKRLKKLKLHHKLPIELEIRPPKGKYAGTYAYKHKDTDILTLRIVGPQRDPYVVAHETGHHIWFQHLTEKQKAKWIKLYRKSVLIAEMKPKDLLEYKKILIESNLNIKEFKKELEDKELLVFDEIIKWVNKTYNLSVRELDVLLKDGDDLSDFWPTKELDISSMDITITDYATKNPLEYFAEAFAFYFIKESLPSKVKKLMRNTLNEIKDGNNKDFESDSEQEYKKKSKSKNKKRRQKDK